MAAKRILYVNLDFPPMSGPGIWRAFWFVKLLHGANFDFTVLCADRSHWCDRTDPQLLRELPEGLHVERVPVRFPREILEEQRDRLAEFRSPLLQRIWHAIQWRVEGHYPDQNFSWLMHAVPTALELHRSRHFDVVVSSGPPHVSHLVGYVLSQLRGVPWIMDYRDLWNDDEYQTSELDYRHSYWSWLERRCVARADQITVVSPAWADWLRNANAPHAGNGHIRVIRNGHALMGEIPAAAPRQDQRRWLHFSGTPQYLSETPAFFQALAKLRDDNGGLDSQLRVSFTGLSRQQRALVESLRLENLVEDVGASGFEDSLRLCRAADALLVLVNDDDPTRQGTIPAKSYEAMAMGKHVFAAVPAHSDLRDLMREYEHCTVCDVGDADDIAAGLQRFLSLDHEAVAESRDHARIFGPRYSRIARAEEFAALLSKLA